MTQRGLQPEPEQRPAGPDGPRTSWLTDPDGYRIELVLRPAAHADGVSAADFPSTRVLRQPLDLEVEVRLAQLVGDGDIPPHMAEADRRGDVQRALAT